LCSAASQHYGADYCNAYFQHSGGDSHRIDPSFIGIGINDPYSPWGRLGHAGARRWRAMRVYPHIILFPTLAIALTILAFNLSAADCATC
jgi:hypothetical protein